MVVLVLVRTGTPLLVRTNSGVGRAQALESGGILSNRSSDGLGVPLESVPSQVGDIVAGLVVVDIVADTSLAAEKFGFFLGLHDLGASEQTARGDTTVKETGVVAAAAEVGGDRVEAVLSEKVLEESLRLCAASRAGLVESAAITVVDAENVVGRGDHVEVKVQADLGCLLLGEILCVIIAAEQAELLCSPEGDTDRVVDGIAGQLLGNLEDADDTRAVVVDTGPSKDTVRVASDD